MSFTGRSARVLIVSLAASSVLAVGGCSSSSNAPAASETVDEGESAYVIWQRGARCMMRKSLAPSIKVCVTGGGDLTHARALTKDSLLKWLDAVRPLNANVTSTIEFTCNAPDGMVSVDNTGEYASPGDVHTYSSSAPGTMLHEFGHAFACLNDTYVGGIAGNCQAGQPHSVMCDGLLRNDLSADDIAGARVQFLAMVGTTTGGGDAGAATDSGTGGQPDSGTGGGANDTDGDGVPNADDRCPKTPPGTHVWHDEYGGAYKGCAPGETPGAGSSTNDADGDGVTDALDHCANTPAGSKIWHDEYNGAYRGCAPGQTLTR